MSLVNKDTKLSIYLTPSWHLESTLVDSIIPIKYPPNVYSRYLIPYFNTPEWQTILKYIFGVFMESYHPYYGDIIYEMKNLKTTINHRGQIIISGIFDSYTQQRIKYLYQQSDAINKTWTQHGKQYLRRSTVENRIKEALWKICTQGELKIPRLPGLCTINVDNFHWL